jgi:tetratricopeptide (TPR) repeat protein
MRTIKSILVAAAVGFFGGSVATAQTGIEGNKPTRPAATAKVTAAERAAGLAEEGEALKRSGDLDAALGKFADALKLDRTNLTALVGAAWILNHAGDHKTARLCATTAVELDPKSGAAWREAGYAEWQLGNLKEAKACLSTSVACNGKDVAALTYLTEVLDDTGDKTEAVKLRKRKAQIESEQTATATRMWY